MKEKWLSSVWQSREHQTYRLSHYIFEGNLEKVKIYINRILKWKGTTGEKRWRTKDFLYVAFENACMPKNSRNKQSADIIYYFINIDLPRDLFLPGEKIFFETTTGPLYFAYYTENLAMIDKLFNTKWKTGYRAKFYPYGRNFICKSGNLDMYRKLAEFTTKEPLLKKAYLENDRVRALVYGHVQLANLIQSMIDEMGPVKPALQDLPAVPPVENLERIRAGPRQLPTKPPAAPI